MGVYGWDFLGLFVSEPEKEKVWYLHINRCTKYNRELSQMCL